MAVKTEKEGKIAIKTFRVILVGVVFVSILGSLSHSFYEWSGKNKLIALFCPVNESTWEHMKLLFFPMLLYIFYIANKWNAKHPSLISAMLEGNICGTFLIPILFYTYSGILGYNITAIDIATFYVSVVAAFAMAWQLNRKNVSQYKNILIGITILVCILFFVFTFYPPGIALFENPV